VGPRAVLDAMVKRKIPSPHRESNPRTPIVQPIEMSQLHGVQSFLDKLTVTQLLKKFPDFYGNQTFITVFERAHH
jgi:hypothetical protein